MADLTITLVGTAAFLLGSRRRLHNVLSGRLISARTKPDGDISVVGVITTVQSADDLVR